MSTAPTRAGLSADRPFPGLRPYLSEDHEFFFGRDDQIYALYRLFDHSHFIAVVGSSGSGKSSLVRAGLLPLLDRESREPTGHTWKMVQMHPGDSPIGNLATAMAQQLSPSDDVNITAALRERIRFALQRSSYGIAGALREVEGLADTSIVLVVDQFEELFRYSARQQTDKGPDEIQRKNEATQFVQILLGASRDRALNVYVLLTMRSDFIGDCANFRGLPEAVSASQFLTPSLTRDQREDAIRRPVEKAGAAIEPALVERLLNDSGDDIDQLPVLQHSLLRLWEQAGRRHDAADGASRRQLTMDDYIGIGGMSGALSKHAEEILDGLSGQILTVEQTFRALAEIDTEGRIIRRARLFKELCGETGMPVNDLRTVIDRFRDDDCSFLTPSKSEADPLDDNTRIDVGHEALLRGWDRVSGDPRTGAPHLGWLRSEVADGRIYRGLLARAESKSDRIPTDIVEDRWKWWNERPRTEDWCKRYGGGKENVEHLFQQSLDWLETEREAERRRAQDAADRQRIEREAATARRTTIIVSALCLIAIILGAASAWQWQIARQQAALAEQESNAAQQQTNIATQQKTLADQQTAIATQNFNASITLFGQLLSQVQQGLDTGQITVDAAEQILASAKTTWNNFQAVDQSQANMASQAQLYVTFADTYSALTDYTSALQYAENAKDIAQQLVTQYSTDTDYQALLFAADYNCGDADAIVSTADAAMQDYQAAQSIVLTLSKDDQTNTRWQQDIAFILNKIGDTYGQQGHPDLALQSYQAALKINQTLASANQGNDSMQRDLATALARVGDAESGSSLTDALALYQQAFTIRQTLAKNNSTDAGMQSNLAAAYSSIAGIYVQQGKFPEAMAQYDAALGIRKTLVSNDPGNAMWQASLASQYTSMGDMLMAQPNYAQAAADYQNSLAIRLNLSNRDASNFTKLRSLADSYTKLAGALLKQNKLPDALSEHNAAVPLRVKIAAQYPSSSARQLELINEYGAIGDIDQLQHDPKDAAVQYQYALNAVQTFVTNNPGSTALNQVSQDFTQKMQKLGATNQ
jgi:tetratricopeptide (TPR) repeat protein